MKPKIIKVILHPGEVTSQHDGDIHFISASKLKELYGVLQTDIIKVFDHHDTMTQERKYFEGWLDLYPKIKGDYVNIHQFDQYEIENP